MARNYRKEYDNYHSRPEQKLRRAARNAARASLKKTTAPEKPSTIDIAMLAIRLVPINSINVPWPP